MKSGIDLFSGAGGMSLGAAMANIEPILSIDNDKYALQTYKKNHPNSLALLTDITQLSI